MAGVSRLQRLALAAVVAVALVALVFTVQGTHTTSEKARPQHLPASIESVSPPSGDLDLRQVEINADLAPGFTPDSIGVDGRDAPRLPANSDVQYVDALNLIRITSNSELRPSSPGLHCAVVVYHVASRPNDPPTTYKWCFTLH